MDLPGEKSRHSEFAKRFRWRMPDVDLNSNSEQLVEQESRLRSKVRKLEKMNEDLRNLFNRQREESSERLDSFHSDLVAKNEKIYGLLKRRGLLIQEKKELERRFLEMEENRKSTESKLLEARNELEDLQCNVKRIEFSWDRVLLMVRNIADLVRKTEGGDEKKDVGFDGKDMDERMMAMIRPFVIELEAIESAFKDREKRIKDMKRTIEILCMKEEEEEEENDFVDVGALLVRTDCWASFPIRDGTCANVAMVVRDPGRLF